MFLGFGPQKLRNGFPFVSLYNQSERGLPQKRHPHVQKELGMQLMTGYATACFSFCCFSLSCLHVLNQCLNPPACICTLLLVARNSTARASLGKLMCSRLTEVKLEHVTEHHRSFQQLAHVWRPVWLVTLFFDICSFLPYPDHEEGSCLSRSLGPQTGGEQGLVCILR